MKRSLVLPYMLLLLTVGTSHLMPRWSTAATTSVKPLAGQYIMDDSQGLFKALTFTSGPLKHFAHNHVFVVRHFNGNVQFDPATNMPPSLQLSVKTGSLESIDDLDMRSRQIINSSVRGHILEAAKYPAILFKSTHATTSESSMAGHYTAEIDGDLTLHGVTHPQHIVADVSVANHWLHASGVLRIRQTDYNIKPESLVGGLIRVNDEVHLVFEIAAYQPVQLSGKVMQYYADCSGFASAVELETQSLETQSEATKSEATTLVYFHPAVGQRLLATYPVGSEATLWTQENSQTSKPHWQLVGWKKEMTLADFQPPRREREMEWLQAQPWITVGARHETIRGRLRRVVAGGHGEIAGLVVENQSRSTPDVNGSDRASILVIVPPELQQITTGPGHGVTVPRGAQIEASGLPVAPRAGAVSVYAGYLSATAIVVNGKSAGATAFGSTAFGSTAFGGTTSSQKPTLPTCPYEPIPLSQLTTE